MECRQFFLFHGCRKRSVCKQPTRDKIPAKRKKNWKQSQPVPKKNEKNVCPATTTTTQHQTIKGC